MELNKKEMYLPPEVDISEMKTEGVICGSLTDSGDYNNGGDPFASGLVDLGDYNNGGDPFVF